MDEDCAWKRNDEREREERERERGREDRQIESGGREDRDRERWGGGGGLRRGQRFLSIMPSMQESSSGFSILNPTAIITQHN